MSDRHVNLLCSIDALFSARPVKTFGLNVLAERGKNAICSFIGGWFFSGHILVNEANGIWMAV